MPVELEITELNDYQKVHEFINGQEKHVTFNMMKKHGGIRPKIARRVLRSHPNTMLCHPLEFGSNKFRNEKLYKKISNDEILTLCNEELDYMKKNRIIIESNVDSYINSGLVRHMMDKYRISLDYTITSQLK
jgi:hypothetical protein